MHIFKPLRSRAFAGLWASYSVSIAATTILPTALTLMILDWENGIGDLGIALSARTLGFLAGAVVGGQIADRLPRASVISVACTLRGFAVLLIAWAFSHELIAICGCLFLAGAGEGAFRSAYQSTMADVVSGDELQRANALTTLSGRIIQTAGPLVAVSLYSLLGGATTLALAGLCWLASALIVFLLRQAYPPAAVQKAQRAGIWTSYRQGLAEARRHRWFMVGLVVLLVWLGLGNSIQQLLLPVISRSAFGGDAFIGIALGAYAVGALAGGILLGHFRLARPGVIAFCGLAVYGLVPLALCSQSAPLILAAYFLGGMGIELFNIPWFTAIQNEVPRDLLGRVSSIDFLVSYGAAPLALAAMPAALALVGQQAGLIATGVIVLVLPVLALRVPGTADFREPASGPGRASTASPP